MIKDSIALTKFLAQFSKNEHAVAVDKIMKSCMVTRMTIYNWKRGLARIPELHKCKIEEIFNQTIFSRIQ